MKHKAKIYKGKRVVMGDKNLVTKNEIHVTDVCEDLGGCGEDDVLINNQEKNIDITENGLTEIIADTGFTGLSKVTVNTNVSSSGGEGDYPVIGDGKTYLYIKIAAEGRMEVPLYFSQTVANGVVIDWGDGSATQTLSDAGNVNTTHTYAEIGDYTISLNPDSGCTLSLGHFSSHCVMGSSQNIGKAYCNMLQAVEIGKNVTSINDAAFRDCRSLASVVIPDSVTSIGNSVLEGCYSLASVVIPDSVTRVGGSMFRDCYSLASIVIPNSVTSIDVYAFYGCYSLASIVIPQGVTRISNTAFSSCYSLASIVIPQGVTSIDDYAFRNCYSLASVVIPDSVTSIGSYAFSSCYSLASIVIPNSVTSIGSSAFRDCSGMAYYDFSQHTSIPAISSETFSGIPSDCEILVPVSLHDEWIKATNWSALASHIISNYTPTECVSLEITGKDVGGRVTSTTLHYTAITNGVDALSGESLTGVEVTGTATSEAFPQNTSYTDTVEREVSFTYLGVTATTTITQGVWVDSEYVLDLNDGQWELSDTPVNPDPSLYDGVYRSVKSKGVNDGFDTMYVDIDGYSAFKLYIRSYAESNYDYVMVSQLDKEITGSTSSDNSTLIKASTKNKSNSDTSINGYTLVEFTGIDEGAHRITIVYRKDGSGDSDDDRGYVLIPKKQ